MNANMFQQFNVGQAIQAGQKITHNRLMNESSGIDLAQRKETIKNQEKAKQIRSTYERMPDQIEQLEAQGLFPDADKLRDNYIRAMKSEVELIESTRNAINEGNYKGFRSDLLRAGAITPEMMPVEYSDSWFKKQVSEKRGNLSKFTRNSFLKGALMSQDIVQQDGGIVWEGGWYNDPKNQGKPGGGAGGSGKPWEYKSADSNTIGRQVASIFSGHGGIWDPQNGTVRGLSKDLTARSHAVQELASRIYQENQGKVTHDVAVARAARTSGINVEDLRDSSQTDPLSLRQ